MPGSLTTSTPAASASQLGTLATISSQNRSTTALVPEQVASIEGGCLAVLHGPPSLVDQDGEPNAATGHRAVRWVPMTSVAGWPQAIDRLIW